MTAQELIAQLQKFPPDTDVEIYTGKCCVVQPIEQVYFHPGGFEDSPMVVLIDQTQQVCVPGVCNCR